MEHNNTNLEQMMMGRAMERKVPVNGSIELLPLCNMNCDMCYVRLSKEEMEKKGRLRTVEEWLTVAREMQNAGTLFLLLTGGEPLLYPGFDELYLELLKMGFIITINSNGTLIDEKWAKFFGEHKPRRINITLYGTNEQIYRDLCHYPGGFARTIQGIRLLREHGVDVKVNGSATKENQGNIKEILEIAEKLEVPVNIDTYMMPGVREREKPYDMQSRLDPIAAANARMEAFKAEMGEDAFLQMAVQQLEMREQFVPEEEKPGQVSCLAGNCSFTINWQGELRPCVMLTKPAVSVFEVGFEKGWKYIVDEVQKLVLSSKCSVCDMRPMCRVCAAGALLETGSYDGVPEYMCLYAKESYRLMEEYVKERAR